MDYTDTASGLRSGNTTNYIRHLDYLQGSENVLSYMPERQHGTLCHNMNSELHQP